MPSSSRTDAVVVGLGGMGAAAAWRLSRSGRSVVALEQFGPGHTRGSSHGAVRIFRVAYRDRRYVELARRALPLWRALEEESGQVLLEQVGQVDHGHAEAVAEVVGTLRAAGLPVDELSPAEAEERWPGMRFGEAVAASPDGGRCFADRTVEAAVTAAVRHGAEVHYETPVVAVQVDGDTARVRTGDHEWVTPLVVVAAGAWVEQVVGGRLALPPVVVEADQPTHFRPRDPAAAWPSFLHHSPETSGPAGLGFAAYGLETPGTGVKVGGYGTVAPADPDHRTPPDPARTDQLVRYVERWLPGLDPAPLDSTSCLFTSTPDEHFVLDRRGPVVVCSPCSGHGFKFVPAIGDVVVDLADGRMVDPAWRLP
ncbi:MAG: FAD-dependent oxidoreductase [Actinomycetes bacterium]